MGADSLLERNSSHWFSKKALAKFFKESENV